MSEEMLRHRNGLGRLLLQLVCSTMIKSVIEKPDEQIEEDVRHLIDWISKEAHLPKIDDEKWIGTFLRQNKYSLEKTKRKLDGYYSLRTKFREIFTNRDPTSLEMMRVREAEKIAVAEQISNDNVWMLYVKFEANVDAFDINMHAKRMFMIMDMLLLKQKTQAIDVVTIVDLKDFKYQHGLKFLTGVGKLAEIGNRAYAKKIKAIHLLNFPPFAQKLLEISQKLYTKKINERTIIHPSLSCNLLEMVDKNVLCSDYGGDGPSLAELEEHTQRELEKYRKWFEEQENVCSNESLRTRHYDQVEEMRGSFKKLEVD